MIHYKNCPICFSDNITPCITAIDYTVSKKQFNIWHCNNCTARFTQDAPEQNEIATYYQSDNYVSHSDTKKGIINNLYHRVRNITLKNKRNLIVNEVEIGNGNILDIGCGTGAFLNTMKVAGWAITGLEPDDTASKKAFELYSIKTSPSEKLFDLTPSNFDAITMWHVLEHVHQLHEYIPQLKKLLTPKGKIFIAVPNYTSYDANVYKASWASYDVPRHLYHFSPKSMQQLLATYHLKISSIKPMWYDSFYVSMLSEKIKNNKGNIFKAFINGFTSNIKAIKNVQNCSSIIYVIEQ